MPQKHQGTSRSAEDLSETGGPSVVVSAWTALRRKRDAEYVLPAIGGTPPECKAGP